MKMNDTSRKNSDTLEVLDCKRIRPDQQIEPGIKKLTMNNNNNNSNMDVFPWITEFRAMSKSSLARPEPSSLIKLIKRFNRNVSCSVNDCYKKSSRAAKLKELIKEALLLFMYFHRFEQPQEQNRATYLEQMSDILAIYVDLELISSKRDVEPQYDRISARLVSCLYIYLENSTEHLLDTLLKVQLVNETHSHILDAIFSKVLKLVPPHPESDLMYVRYLLVYRLWKKIHSNLAVKKQINTAALTSLRLNPPSDLPSEILERVLPPNPTSPQQIKDGVNEQQQQQQQQQSTKFYLCQHFDLRNACTQFLRYCRRDEENDGDSNERDQRLKSTITSETNKLNSVNSVVSKSSNSIPSKSNSVKITANNNIPLSKLTLNESHSSNETNTAKSNNNSNKKQQKDIVLIDLTDDDVTKIVTRKRRRKIGWLEDAKKIIHAKIKEAVAAASSTSSSSTTTAAATTSIEESTLKINNSEINPQPEDNKVTVPVEETKEDSNSALSVEPIVVGRTTSVITRRVNSIEKTDTEPKVQDETNNDVVNSYYDENIDGLTLLASVSAERISNTNKKVEIKVKPYASLQKEKVEEDNIPIPMPVQEPQEMLSYVLDETNLETNDNANVILNGETIMLLQKSPNSNLYIINKADSSKLNYNSDDELDNHQLEDTKPLIKPDPDELESKPTTFYPGNYLPYQHPLSVDCACVNCVYCRPYYQPPPQPSGPKICEELKFSKEIDSKLPLKKRLRVSMDFDAYRTVISDQPPELGAVVEVTSVMPTKPTRGRPPGNRSNNQNVPNCFPRKSSKKRKIIDDVEVEKKPRKPRKQSTRSSKRSTPQVNYVYPEPEVDCNPSAGGKKRKKNKSGR